MAGSVVEGDANYRCSTHMIYTLMDEIIGILFGVTNIRS